MFKAALIGTLVGFATTIALVAAVGLVVDYLWPFNSDFADTGALFGWLLRHSIWAIVTGVCGGIFAAAFTSALLAHRHASHHVGKRRERLN